ncbi:MAG: phosphoribosylanthranilate isomerase [Syntrophobacterales bacterium]|nr:MAG: phosphoribosylanthranilate isomerase [Syntrophobacterales bacterium]
MTEIKICGITTMEDASFTAECGVDALGFIFYARSPRYVAPERAREIIESIPDGITNVGVFVNHDALEVKKIVEFCGLDLVQLHGDESPEYCRQFPASLLIKAFSPRREAHLRKLSSYPVRAILVDAYNPCRYGGTGKRSDWRLAAMVKQTHPLILSGGLNGDNIRQAIEIVSPHAVDINSGVESCPGRKDPEKVSAIIDIVRRIDGKGTKIFQRRSAMNPDIS